MYATSFPRKLDSNLSTVITNDNDRQHHLPSSSCSPVSSSCASRVPPFPTLLAARSSQRSLAAGARISFLASDRESRLSRPIIPESCSDRRWSWESQLKWLYRRKVYRGECGNETDNYLVAGDHLAGDQLRHSYLLHAPILRAKAKIHSQHFCETFMLLQLIPFGVWGQTISRRRVTFGGDTSLPNDCYGFFRRAWYSVLRGRFRER